MIRYNPSYIKEKDKEEQYNDEKQFFDDVIKVWNSTEPYKLFHLQENDLVYVLDSPHKSFSGDTYALMIKGYDKIQDKEGFAHFFQNKKSLPTIIGWFTIK